LLVNMLLERAEQGTFHYMNQKYLSRYLNEIGFRSAHRVPKKDVTKHHSHKTVMVALTVIDMLCSLLTYVVGRQLRRTTDGGIQVPNAEFVRA
jgi:hypothetical protein